MMWDTLRWLTLLATRWTAWSSSGSAISSLTCDLFWRLLADIIGFALWQYSYIHTYAYTYIYVWRWLLFSHIMSVGFLFLLGHLWTSHPPTSTPHSQSVWCVNLRHPHHTHSQSISVSRPFCMLKMHSFLKLTGKRYLLSHFTITFVACLPTELVSHHCSIVTYTYMYIWQQDINAIVKINVSKNIARRW